VRRGLLRDAGDNSAVSGRRKDLPEPKVRRKSRYTKKELNLLTEFMKIAIVFCGVAA
jgi:hypothetical protein